MARTPTITAGERLRRAAEKLMDCADRWEGAADRHQLHDDVETALDDARIVVRGRGFR
jgi:hypothetical protein